MELARMNTPVALYLSQCLLDACKEDLLSENWVPTVSSPMSLNVDLLASGALSLDTVPGFQHCRVWTSTEKGTQGD